MLMPPLHLCASISRGLLLASALVLAMSMAPQPQKQPIKTAYFTIETGSSSGSNFAIGSALATILSNPPGSVRCQIKTACGPPGLIAVALTSTGTVANARDVALGRVESALVPANIAAAAYQGRDAFKSDGPSKDLRAIGRLYPEAVQIVAAKGRIRSLADLKGRSIAIDAPGTATNTVALDVLAAANIPRKSLKLMEIDADRAADLLAAHRIDGFFLVSAVPSQTVERLAARTPIELVPVGPSMAKRLDAAIYLPQAIAAGTYEGVGGVQTVSLGMLWIVSARADNELIRQLTAALWDDANASFFSGQRVLRDAAHGVPIPLHPGAAQFYRQRGILPAQL